jgi:hypothetical protein
MRRLRLKRRLVRCLGKAGVSIGALHIRDSGGGLAHDLALAKNGRDVDLALDFRSALDNAQLAAVFRTRAVAIIDPFARSRASAAFGNVSDGEEGRPGAIVFSANNADAILVPDSVFYETRGYASFRAAAEAWETGWAVRLEPIVWRGTTTGAGPISSAEMAPDDAGLLQRTRMCLILRAAPGVDAKFAGIAQSVDPRLDRLRLQQSGILADYIDPMTWLVRKFAIDIDGNTNAWSNLFTRLLAGCCVIKIASPSDYRQWYYDALIPWQHFVPVKADMSDLREKIDWCRTHDAECAEIASAGRDLVRRRDFATEMKLAVETLDERLGAD